MAGPSFCRFTGEGLEAWIAADVSSCHIAGMEDDRVVAAGRVIYDAGREHHWSGFERSFDELDPIAKSEFLGIVEQALLAADTVNAEAPNEDEPRKPAGALGLTAIPSGFDDSLPENIQAVFEGR